MKSIPLTLITGATKGMGNRMVNLFAKDGLRFVIANKDETELDKLAAMLSAKDNMK